MYDAIVIGARCAGASTAMLMARKGLKVLLVDRATFPKDIPHGHFIHRHGPLRLHRWGLLDRLVATGCPPVTSISSDYGDVTLRGSGLVREGVAAGYGPRRSVLDKLLVDAAVEAGVELREGFAVEEFSSEDGRVTGIRGRARETGAMVSERARVTIGADGRNSRLAKTVGATATEVVAPLTAWYFSYWSGVESRGLEVVSLSDKVLFSFPTNDGLHAVFIGWAVEHLPRVRADVEQGFMDALGEAPDLAGRVRAGRREERLYGMADVPNFLRKPWGPGWALVGDAGCHKDPYHALGICDAFRDAELLAEAVHAGLSGADALENALAGYERRRNEATLPDYRQNLERARFTPLPPEMVALRRALLGNEAETQRFYLAAEGMIEPASFFEPANLRRIVASAMA